jgi:hypothetical protein
MQSDLLRNGRSSTDTHDAIEGHEYVEKPEKCPDHGMDE